MDLVKTFVCIHAKGKIHQRWKKSIKEIDDNGIEKGAHSSTYDVLYNNKRYPPKLVVSLANKFANGNILSRDSFRGGDSLTPCSNSRIRSWSRECELRQSARFAVR